MPLNQTLRKKSHVLWTLSIIQDISPDAQTKSEFSEMVNDVVSMDTIETITLCLADNLQRFRLMIQDNLTEEDAIMRCQQMTKIWHEDNPKSLEKLKETKNLSFITWQQFLDWPEYVNTIKAVESWYKENKEFRNDVDGRVRQELRNIKSDAKLTDPAMQTSLLKRYLFEECAFQKFAASKHFNYEIYKTPMNKAMRRIKNNSDFVPPGYMVEVHFAQFNPSAKKVHANHQKSIEKSTLSTTPPKESDNKTMFPPLFNNHQSLKTLQTITDIVNLSYLSNDFDKEHVKKVSIFIENAIDLLPQEKRDDALKALMQFTTKEIMPLYYSNNTAVLKQQ